MDERLFQINKTILSVRYSREIVVKHFNRLRTFYRKRQNALLAAIHEVLGSNANISGEGAGMSILLTINNSLSQNELIKRAETIGIRVYSIAANYMNPTDCPHSQISLGFATIPQI